MKFIFQTEHLNEKLYRRIFKTEAQQQFTDHKDFRQFWRDNKNYQVIIRPSHMASEDPFFHGKDGVGGVTDKTKMVLYLEDKHEPPKDIVQRVLRKNANVISHEGGHHKLMYLNMSHKVPLRHDDFSGHKAGTMLNFWTAEVHDRDTENRKFTKTFWIWAWNIRSFGWHKYTMSFLDFRDLL